MTGNPQRPGNQVALSRPGLDLLLLLLCAVFSAAIVIVALSQPLWVASYYDKPHQDIPKLMGVSNDSLLWFASTATELFILYLAAFLLARRLRSRRHAALVLALSGLLCLSLLPMFPGAAGDVYAYIAEADLVLRYHANPFLTPIAAFPGYSLLPFIDFPGETTHYGPLWSLTGVPLRALSGNGLLEGLLAFKVAAALFLLATASLVYLTLKQTRPEQAVSGALLVAWNPLLLFETAGNAHNDIAMMLFVAFAFYLHVRRRPWMAISALIAATLVKYVAAVLLPLFVIGVLRSRFLEACQTPADGRGPTGARPATSVPETSRRNRDHTAHRMETVDLIRALVMNSYWRAIAYLLGVLALGAVLVATVGYQGTVGVMLNQSGWFTTSPQAVAYLWLSQAAPAVGSSDVVSRVGQALFGLVLVLEVRRVWVRPGALAESSLRVMLALLLLGLSWFEPWYVTWAIPIGAIAGTRSARAAALTLGAGAFGAHSVMGFGWRLDWHQGNIALVHAAGAAAVWLPTFVAILTARFHRPPAHKVDRPCSAQLSLHEGATM